VRNNNNRIEDNNCPHKSTQAVIKNKRVLRLPWWSWERRKSCQFYFYFAEHPIIAFYYH